MGRVVWHWFYSSKKTSAMKIQRRCTVFEKLAGLWWKRWLKSCYVKVIHAMFRFGTTLSIFNRTTDFGRKINVKCQTKCRMTTFSYPISSWLFYFNLLICQKLYNPFILLSNLGFLKKKPFANDISHDHRCILKLTPTNWAFQYNYLSILFNSFIHKNIPWNFQSLKKVIFLH